MVELESIHLFHAEILAIIHQQCFKKPWTKDFFERLLIDSTNCPALGWIVLQNKEPVGFILARHLMTETEILTFCILPNFRNKGLGQALVKQLIQNCQKPIFLEVAIHNQSALNLYQQADFVITGKRKNYYDDQPGQPEDAYVMEYK